MNSATMKHRMWTLMKSALAGVSVAVPEKTEVPHGMNMGPRERLHLLIPDNGTKHSRGYDSESRVGSAAIDTESEAFGEARGRAFIHRKAR